MVAGVAIVVSLCTFVLTYRASRQAERRGRMPVLVVFPEANGWRLENIGNGAALNIVIAQGHGPRGAVISSSCRATDAAGTTEWLRARPGATRFICAR